MRREPPSKGGSTHGTLATAEPERKLTGITRTSQDTHPGKAAGDQGPGTAGQAGGTSYQGSRVNSRCLTASLARRTRFFFVKGSEPRESLRSATVPGTSPRKPSPSLAHAPCTFGRTWTKAA